MLERPLDMAIDVPIGVLIFTSLGDDLALRFDGAFLVALVALRFASLTIFVEDEIDASGAVGSDTFASCNILAADLTLPAVFWDIRVHLASSSCRYGIAIDSICQHHCICGNNVARRAWKIKILDY